MSNIITPDTDILTPQDKLLEGTYENLQAAIHENIDVKTFSAGNCPAAKAYFYDFISEYSFLFGPIRTGKSYVTMAHIFWMPLMRCTPIIHEEYGNQPIRFFWWTCLRANIGAYVKNVVPVIREVMPMETKIIDRDQGKDIEIRYVVPEIDDVMNVCRIEPFGLSSADKHEHMRGRSRTGLVFNEFNELHDREEGVRMARGRLGSTPGSPGAIVRGDGQPPAETNFVYKWSPKPDPVKQQQCKDGYIRKRIFNLPGGEVDEVCTSYFIPDQRIANEVANPIMDKNWYDRAARGATPNWIKHNITGECASPEESAVVFPQFKSDVHVIPYAHKPGNNLIWGVDQGNYGGAILLELMRYRGRNSFVVLDAIKTDQRPTSALAEDMIRLCYERYTNSPIVGVFVCHGGVSQVSPADKKIGVNDPFIMELNSRLQRQGNDIHAQPVPFPRGIHNTERETVYYRNIVNEAFNPHDGGNPYLYVAENNPNVVEAILRFEMKKMKNQQGETVFLNKPNNSSAFGWITGLPYAMIGAMNMFGVDTYELGTRDYTTGRLYDSFETIASWDREATLPEAFPDHLKAGGITPRNYLRDRNDQQNREPVKIFGK